MKQRNWKYKFLIMSKRNIIKIITVCFWCYMAISLTSILKDFFITPNWNQIAMQYSKFEIIMECITYVIGRFNFRKFTSYINIFRY